MESQVENAVEIVFNPNSDGALKEQALNFLNQLREDPTGWQVCASLFVRTPKASEVVRHTSLEIVNHAVQSERVDTSTLTVLKDTLLDYIRRIYADGNTTNEPTDTPHIQNKLSQTITYLFCFLYRDGWQSFIDDFLAFTTTQNSSRPDNAPGVILYLRILGSLHDEIADLLLSRQNHDLKRNSELKDLVRSRDMPKITRSWQEFLGFYSGQDDVVVEKTLKVMGKWVSWTDIQLVVSQDTLNLLFPLIGRTNPESSEDRVRDAAISAFTEIVGKKMKPSDKTEMISYLSLKEIVSQLVESPPLSEFQNTSRYDTDLGEAVAKLVNTIMTDIVIVLADNSQPQDVKVRAEQHLIGFLPFLLRFFSDEYDEICSTVIPSLTDLLTYLRKVPELPASYNEVLPHILNAVIMKMRYDETSSWGAEDSQTDEAEFQELRKKLHLLQKSVAAVNQDLFVDVVSNLVATTFQTLQQQGSQMDWRDLDLALHEMHLFGEVALPNPGQMAKGQVSSVASERLGAVMSKMVESDIIGFAHPAILLQYMEICVRYCAFFESQRHYIPRVLESFVQLVHHNHVRIRTRSWYLFHRFVKQLRAHVGNVAEDIISAISDLLPIKAEVSGEDSDNDMSSDETDNSADALFNSQLYLFEAIGCISSTSATPAEKQALYARTVMDPLFSDIELHLPRAKTGDAQAILQIHHIIMALGTLAHGFTDWTPGASTSQGGPPDKLVAEEFSRAAEAILFALSELNHSVDIRTAARSSFSRLLGVLGSAMLPTLPKWIEGLLSQSSTKDEMAMFLRLLDQVVYGFKSEIYSFLDILLTPLLERVFGGLSEPATGTDDEVQLAELRREYLSFLNVILSYKLEGVLISETNQGVFESIITSVVSLSKMVGGQSADLSSSRSAFSVMKEMAKVWGGPNIATVGENPSISNDSSSPSIPGFDQYMLDKFHATCWDVLQNTEFRPGSDAQTRQVLGEIGLLEQAIYQKTGNQFVQNITTSLFPSFGLDGNDYLRCLTSTQEKKVLSQYFLGLLKSRG
ncbi:hypothetical protein MKZ38_010773 [Zalerion maritima]|uniref:Exportin-T n=1 Tax=Zalerion maritima TaxID=339359 RepID=A0AAD5WYA7_9PEZI|nr:hypothetical protein MKZ38_010773 [Zalerion maritima]